MYTRCLKNVTNLSCYNFDVHEPILAIFGRKVIEKVSSQKMLSSFSFPSHLTSAYAVQGGQETNCCRAIGQEKGSWEFCTAAVWLLNAGCTSALCNWMTKLSQMTHLIESKICWHSKISKQYCPLAFTPGLTKNNSHYWHSDRHSDTVDKRQAWG